MPEIKTDTTGGEVYDVAIIGGGLAGLALSILMVKKEYKVILFEKEKYPFHRVCGEYISNESRKFIEQELGLNLRNLNVSEINKLMVSSGNGYAIHEKLDTGGFGISRYCIDHELKKIAVAGNVHVAEKTKVTDVEFKNDLFEIKYTDSSVRCKVAVAGFGKRSNLDAKWSRTFIKKKPNKLNNYIGVKYHIKTNFTADTIALHNFSNGYCGLSRIENNTYCLCYLTTAENLRNSNNSIKDLEKNVLYKNVHLKKIFTESEFLFSEPVVISQISFDKKNKIENHILMMGDAAGMITPLCGNGMSMALHSSKIASGFIDLFLQKKITRGDMEKMYERQWSKLFERRLRIGRIIQKLFGKDQLTNIFIYTIKHFPFLIRKLIKATHGKEF